MGIRNPTLKAARRRSADTALAQFVVEAIESLCLTLQEISNV
jgi:hypothetical protein